MSALETRFIEPLDVLFLRGNKLFGDPGSYGEALIPPWPSAAAGALRARRLADAGVDLAAFARGEIDHPELGTPKRPGPFTVTAFHLARHGADGAVEPLYAPPADLVISRDDGGQLQVRAPTPTSLTMDERQKLSARILSSAPLPWLPVLAERQRGKPESGYWLTAAGWREYLAGLAPAVGHWVHASELWAIDPRVGVGLDAEARCAADGKLFTVQAVAMRHGVGFLARVEGASLPKTGMLRLGGDGRAAALTPAEVAWPEPDYAAIAAARRCRLVLTTPGLFSTLLPPGESALSGAEEGPGVRGGWLPTGISRHGDGGYRFDLHGVKGRLVCAAVPRAEVVSGWDLAQWQPKPAQRAAPTGSVYWLDELEATPEALCNLVERGLWTETGADSSRRAEGFNRASLAHWMSP
jgi:CRISPR-associated protein (Cas_Cmr3).